MTTVVNRFLASKPASMAALSHVACLLPEAAAGCIRDAAGPHDAQQV